MVKCAIWTINMNFRVKKGFLYLEFRLCRRCKSLMYFMYFIEIDVFLLEEAMYSYCCLCILIVSLCILIVVYVFILLSMFS